MNRAGLITTAVVAIAVAFAAMRAMQPRIYGLFHDDAIYMATARSLAEGDGYRHASLPGEPVQTKYPPLYAGVLALVWKVAPEFPANVRWFKATSAFFLGLSVLLAGMVAARRMGGVLTPAVAGLLVGLSPLVFPFSDYALSELPFLALCLLAFRIAPLKREQESDLARAAALGIVCGLALLVRHAALPLVLAGLVCYAPRREWRALGAFLLPIAVLVAPWLVFRAAHLDGAAHPVIAYYLTYEPSVPALALSDPGLATWIFTMNVFYLWRAVDLALFVAYFPAVRLVVYPVLAYGLWRLLRNRIDFMNTFALLYTALILLWPWEPSRYAIPLVPVVVFAVLLATHRLGRPPVRASEPHDAAPPAGGTTVAPRMLRLRRAAAWIPAWLIVLMAAFWLRAFAPVRDDVIRVPYMAWLDYGWDGFEETTRWITDNTPPDAVLATGYDPLYALGTRRHAVRPWLHQPWTYFYARDGRGPDIGTADVVLPALDSLGVRYLIIDPLGGYAEEPVAGPLFDDLLSAYAPPRYDGEPVLRFTSRDGLHRVYELPARAPPGADTTGR